MLRTWILCAAAVVLPLPALAQNEPPPPTETVVKFVVEAKAAPKPLSRYLLLPELREMNPGNPFPEYLKCFMEQQNFFFNKQMTEERERYLTAPLNELPDLKEYGGNALRQADYAARLTTLDWQVLPRLKVDGINLLLPDIQQLRMLAGALKVRLRGDVKDRRFDDAIAHAKTMFALSRHLGEHPTLIGDLVGIAIGTIGVGGVEEMMQQPGCPNLYWAFAALPHPFIDLRIGLEGERIILSAEFWGLLDKPEPLSEAQLAKILQKTRQLRDITEGLNKAKEDPESDPVKLVQRWAKDEKRLAAARQILAETGASEEQIQMLPAVQLILLSEARRYDILRDEGTKWTTLPYWQAEPYYLRLVKKPGSDEQVPNPIRERGLGEGLFTGLAATVTKVHMAQARIQQRIDLLQHVEALRLYAAEHDGKLPAKLSDINLPLPVDSFSGKPYRYELTNDTAVLRGSPPKGMEKVAVYNYRYEVTIKK
jgi:hypothetical protein